MTIEELRKMIGKSCFIVDDSNMNIVVYEITIDMIEIRAATMIIGNYFRKAELVDKPPIEKKSSYAFLSKTQAEKYAQYCAELRVIKKYKEENNDELHSNNG